MKKALLALVMSLIIAAAPLHAYGSDTGADGYPTAQDIVFENDAPDADSADLSNDSTSGPSASVSESSDSETYVDETDSDQDVSENDPAVSSSDETENPETPGSEVDDITKSQETEADKKITNDTENTDDTVLAELSVQETEAAAGWTVSDFTYGDYEKELYGCDYTREFTISGKVVTGFSDEGLAKLESNKNLILPSTDTEGNVLVGVGQSAFYDKGLESVTFPTGMMVSYDDTVTHRVTKRGNYVVAESAFAKNNLTEVYLPSGVIAVLPNAFMSNKLQKVTIPRTIWWIETQSFAKNQITHVSFPETTDFQFEMHGMAFADNLIKSVRIPDYTEVINKYTFVLNPGMEECDPKAGEKECSLGGVVYMYTDNLNLKYKDRIHHLDRPTASQKAWHQKLVVIGSSDSSQDPDTLNWSIEDFTVDGTVITGLSESGIAKRALNKNLFIPNYNKAGKPITGIADSDNLSGGLFATADEKFESVRFPGWLKKIGANAFSQAGLKDVVFPAQLEEIGISAFKGNDFSSVILPDTVTALGKEAFASNPALERISLSKGLTEIPDYAFGCDAMEKLTGIDIPDTIIKIGTGAFAGNNFHEINIPSSVTEIASLAFSTKSTFKDECALTLPEGLKTIGFEAFKNKTVKELSLPQSVEALLSDTFKKDTPDGTKTQVYVSTYARYEDKNNFPDSVYHVIIYTGADQWTAEDFTYGSAAEPAQPQNMLTVVTGLTDSGKSKILENTELVIPAADPSGHEVQGVSKNAFNAANDGFDAKLTSVALPENSIFIIGDGAFANNEIRSIDLPEGVFYIATNAFMNNSITSVTLPASLKFIGNMAFGFNQLQSVQLPDKIAVVHKWAFIANPGKEEVTAQDATAEEKAGGIVYMYINDTDPGKDIAHTENTDPDFKSNVQKLISGNIPDEESRWNASDFTYSDDGAVITGLAESGQKKIQTNPNLMLPDESPEGVTITEIGSGITNSRGTFDYIDGENNHFVPTTVKFPSGLKKIGSYAFAAQLDSASGKQNGLISLIIPDTVEEIGTMAFRYVPITSVTVPDSVTTLGTGAFATADIAEVRLTSAVLSSNLTEIPATLFSGQLLTQINIPDGVTTIGSYAFNGCPLISLDLPDSLTSIGNCAFQNHQLSSLDIPSGVVSIGNYAFKSFSEKRERTLSSLKLHEGLSSIGKEAFAGSILKTTDLPQSVTVLDKDAFKENKSGESAGGGKVLLNVINQDQAAGVGNYGKVVTEGSGHIIRCSEKMYGTDWNEFDFTYSSDGTTITGWSESGQKKRLEIHDLILPDTSPSGVVITAISDEAFMIPEAEVSINKYEAISPNGIQTVLFPAGLEKIGDRAFEYNNLKELSFDSTPNLTSIGESTFHGNHLPRVHLPDTVNELGSGAFSMNEITDLRLSANVTVIPQGAFSMNIRLEQISIPDTVTQIGEMAFAGARLTSLTIPSSVTKIERKAFHLHRLKELTIPGTLKEIGESAFEGTFKGTTLKNLVLEEGIEKIGSRAFKEGLLETVALPESLKELGTEPFENNTGKNGDGIVVLTTTNPEHLKFDNAKTHVIRYYSEPAEYAVTKNDGNGQWIKGSAGTVDGIALRSPVSGSAGRSSSANIKKSSPVTSDKSGGKLWLMLMLFGFTGLIAAVIIRRKSRA